MMDGCIPRSLADAGRNMRISVGRTSWWLTLVRLIIQKMKKLPIIPYQTLYSTTNEFRRIKQYQIY